MSREMVRVIDPSMGVEVMVLGGKVDPTVVVVGAKVAMWMLEGGW